MKTKIATAAVLLGVSSLANAADPLPAPSIYDNGPAAPILNTTDMRVEEKSAFSMMEAFMQTTESWIYAKSGCPSLSVDIEVYSHSGSSTHFIEDKTFGGIRLVGKPGTIVANFGQSFDVSQPVAGVMAGTPVQGAHGLYVYNNLNNMMVGEKFSAQVRGQNRSFDQFYSTVIKDFYYGNTYSPTGVPQIIYDYGLQALSKFGYPVNKYWQRSISVRDDGQPACTVFQKDRLVGSSECRIVLSTTGYNQDGLFWQNGTLTVAKVKPGAATPELDSCGINPTFP